MDVRPSSPIKTLGWAMYLACSWTWCIGMFLPVLLYRDFGPWGLVVFAVPNVVGAAAMGWVISRQGAERLVHHHARAIRAFSACTVAFQIMFLVWLVKLEFVNLPALLVPLCVFIALLIAPARRIGDGLIGAAILALSVAVFSWQWYSGGFAIKPKPPELPTDDVLFLLPVCIFGFLLCPYLDPTFLKARRMLDDARSGMAFTIGFFGPFALMLLGTFAYAGWWLATKPGAPPRHAWILSPILITLHVLPHLAFVVGTQCKEGVQIGRIQQPTLPFVYAILIGLNLAWLPEDLRLSWLNDMPLFEAIYRTFMGAYGLVFPAYVWICVVPTADGHSGPRRDKMTAFVAAVALASPFFFMGFLMRQTEWLGPGVAIALLARFAVREHTRVKDE